MSLLPGSLPETPGRGMHATSLCSDGFPHVLHHTAHPVISYLGDSSASCLSPLPDYVLCEGRHPVYLLNSDSLGSTMTFDTQ